MLKSIKKSNKRIQGGLRMSFTWIKELETANKQANEEHEELIQAINNLLAVCGVRKGRKELSQNMGFLNQDTKIHFGHE